MELEFDVQMNAGVLYDYYIYHIYRSAAGIIGTIVGLIMMASFVKLHNPIYLVCGAIIVLYLPLNLFLTSRRQAATIPVYKEPIHYKLNSEGISISQNESNGTHEWDVVKKAVSTGKSIILYTSKNTATIFPREALGDDVSLAIQIICANVDPKKVKIKC